MNRHHALCLLAVVVAVGCVKRSTAMIRAGEQAEAEENAQRTENTPLVASEPDQAPATEGPQAEREPTPNPDLDKSSKTEPARRAEPPIMSREASEAYESGLKAFQVGDLKQAEVLLVRAATVDPKAYPALYALGAVAERSGSVGSALDAYRRCLGIKASYPPAVLAITKLYLAQGRQREAERFLLEQRGRAPNSAGVLTGLAELKSAERDSVEAQRLAQEALKRDPDFRPAMMTLAKDHYRNRRLDLALYTLAAILDGYGPENPPRDPNNAEARYLRALILKEQGHRRDAIGDLRRAVALRPDLVEARLHLAVLLLETGNSTEAVPLLEGCLRYEPGNVLAHLNLGDAYRLAGRTREALQHLAWVAKTSPRMPQVYYDLGLVYLFSTQVDGVSPEAAVARAITAFETYAQLAPAGAAAANEVDELLRRAKNKQTILKAMRD